MTSPDYPAEIASFREVKNIPGQVYDEAKQTTIFAEDIVKMRAEIQAIQEILGTTGQGTLPLIGGRLGIAEEALANIFASFADGSGIKTHIGSIAYNSNADFEEVAPGFFPSFVLFFRRLPNSTANSGIQLGFANGQAQRAYSTYNSTTYSSVNRAFLISVNGTSIHTGFSVPYFTPNGFYVDGIEYTNNQTIDYLAVGLNNGLEP